VLAQVESAREEIVSLSGVVTGRLTIAASTTPGVYVIPRLLGRFLSTYPEVGVGLLVHDTAEVIALVESGEAHVGIAGSTVRGARVAYHESGADELVLICPPGHRLAAKRKVALADLADETWIMREAGSGTRQIAERVLTEQGLDTEELRVAVELGTGEAIVNAVEGGLGVSILSRLVAGKAIELGTVVEVEAVGLPATRPFYLVMPKGTPTRAATAFHEYLVAALDQG
jgi:DNA-binding transcriptional LysR family regulator